MLTFETFSNKPTQPFTNILNPHVLQMWSFWGIFLLAILLPTGTSKKAMSRSGRPWPVLHLEQLIPASHPFLTTPDSPAEQPLHIFLQRRACSSSLDTGSKKNNILFFQLEPKWAKLLLLFPKWKRLWRLQSPGECCTLSNLKETNYQRYYSKISARESFAWQICSPSDFFGGSTLKKGKTWVCQPQENKPNPSHWVSSQPHLFKWFLSICASKSTDSHKPAGTSHTSQQPSHNWHDGTWWSPFASEIWSPIFNNKKMAL